MRARVRVFPLAVVVSPPLCSDSHVGEHVPLRVHMPHHRPPVDLPLLVQVEALPVVAAAAATAVDNPEPRRVEVRIGEEADEPR